VTDQYWINCSDSCEPSTAECPTACSSKSFFVSTDSTFRLPNQPGRAPGCMCPSVPFVIGGFTNLATWNYRIKVSMPWRVRNSEGALTRTFCAPETGSGCIIMEGGQSFLVYTEDPNAPARNLTVERVTPDQTCD